MIPRLTVLGGSSPFVAELIDALVARGASLPPHEVVLFGRDEQNLNIVARYAKNLLAGLGWSIESSTDLPTALQGAHIVLHQVRYGGLEGREADEGIALSVELSPDETLGPAAVQSCLRLAPALGYCSRMIGEHCPDAWVINLTNPLSITTALMVSAGVRRCVGLCELPRVTARKAASIIRHDIDEINWSYVGLNHRGFIVRFSHLGIDQIQNIARSLRSKTLSGVRAEEIIALHAIPTKYFCLLEQKGALPIKGGRSEFLRQLRTQILAELRADPTSSPPSLKKRYMAWYRFAVIPFIEAIYSKCASLLEVNVMTEKNVVEEVRAYVSQDKMEPCRPAINLENINHWLTRFYNHERLLLRAIKEPSVDAIHTALLADPMIPNKKADQCTKLIWANMARSL